MIYKMKIADSVDEMVFDLLEVPIEDKDIEGTADNTTIDGNVFTDYLWLKKQFTQKWSLMCKDDYTQLRGFYTRQWENAEVPTYKLYVGNDIRETKSATGNSFQITNSTEYDAPITDFKLDGNTEQTGTPTPDSPQPINTTTGENVVKIMGKNLWQDGDRSFTTSYQKYNLNIPAGTYTFSAIVTSSDTSSQYSRAYFYAGNTSIGYVSLTRGARSSGTVTLNSTADRISLYASVDYASSNGKTATFADIQLELGSTATAYEPYQGQTLPVNLASKNLFDSEIEQGGFTGTGLNNPASNRLRTVNYIPVSPNTQYSIKVNNFNTSLGSICGVNVSYYAVADYSTARISEKGWQTASGDNVATFTTPANCHYIRFLLSIGSTASGGSNLTPSDVSQVQLEKGDSVSSYEAYWKIELCKIGTYQDYIWNDNGTWKVHKAVGKHTLDGSENWFFGQTLTNTTHFNIGDFTTVFDGAKVPIDDTQIGLCISDYFIEKANLYNIDQVGIDLHQNKNLIVGVQNSIATTVADFKTWLGTHNTTVYYILATPTDTAITESALITQLNAIVQASLPVGLNNVSNISITPNLAGEMEISYELIHEKETIIRDTTPVRLTLTDGGVINPCECRQNVQITMRETTQ